MIESPQFWAKNFEAIDIAKLKPYKKNPRLHSQKQIELLAGSIEEWGFTVPILIDEEQNVLSGHGRLEAAKKLELKQVPCITAQGWSEQKKRAYIIADNKIAQLSSWDPKSLQDEFAFLDSLGYELEKIGFDEDEIKRIANDVDLEALEDLATGAEEEGEVKTDFEYGTYPFGVSLTYEDRQLVYEAITKAKKTYNLTQSSDALVQICKEYI